MTVLAFHRRHTQLLHRCHHTHWRVCAFIYVWLRQHFAVGVRRERISPDGSHPSFLAMAAMCAPFRVSSHLLRHIHNVDTCVTFVFQGKMVLALSKDPSARLLKHVVRCYLRLSDNPR